MPVSVSDIEALKLTVAKLTGDVPLDQLYALDERLRSSPPDNDLLVVEEPGARITASASSLRDFAASELVFSADSRRVIMATDDIMFGLSRMYSMSATQTQEEIMVCKTVEEAAEALNIPHTDLTAAIAATDDPG